MAGGSEPLAKRTRRLLAELDRKPRRSRGQNFLVDPTLAARIVGFVTDEDRPRVLEIGAGLGALTDPLSLRATEVVALELDETLAAGLGKLTEDRANVHVVCADALRVDFARLLGDDFPRWRVVGNLPYYAATAIVLRLLGLWPPFDRIVTTVQREVGERLLARPGDSNYGSLTVLTAYYVDDARIVSRVPRGAFYPQPKVDSAVVLLTPRRRRPADILSEELLFAAIRAGFAHRRKQLVNSLSTAAQITGIDRDAARGALARAGVGERARAQELGLDEFVRVSNALWESGVRPVASGP